MPIYHDALFKQVFSQPRHAAGELRHVLPDDLAAVIDWETLRLEPGSFVDPELTQQHADLLFSARAAGEQVLLYFLLEHKSGAPVHTLLQLLRYMVRIWSRAEDELPRGASLPPIVPVLIRHGATPWRGPCRFRDLIDCPEELAGVFEDAHLDFRVFMDDLATQEPAALRRRAMSALGRLTLLGLKRALQRGDVIGELREWSDLVRQASAAPDAQELLAGLLWYMMVKIQGVDGRDLMRWIGDTLGPGMEREMKTIQEYMREEMQAEAHQRGHEEGREEGRRETIAMLLRARFGDLPAAVEDRLRAGSPEQLSAWALRVLSATDLDEVFADPT